MINSFLNTISKMTHSLTNSLNITSFTEEEPNGQRPSPPVLEGFPLHFDHAAKYRKIRAKKRDLKSFKELVITKQKRQGGRFNVQERTKIIQLFKNVDTSSRILKKLTIISRRRDMSSVFTTENPRGIFHVMAQRYEKGKIQDQFALAMLEMKLYGKVKINK